MPTNNLTHSVPDPSFGDIHRASEEALKLAAALTNNTDHQSIILGGGAAAKQQADKNSNNITNNNNQPPFRQCRYPRRAATFLRKGHLELVKDTIYHSHCTKLFLDIPSLSGSQQRNLEHAVNVPVYDRTALILKIFSKRAQTREAKLQVELASLEYQGSRLVRGLDAVTGRRTGGFGGTGGGMVGEGEGGGGGQQQQQLTEVVSARQRGSSGGGGLGGGGGSGESEIQLQRQRLLAKKKKLATLLEDVQRTRQVQRAGRHRMGVPLVALVGYTNAGKTSLLAALSRNERDGEGVEDKLFATLDPLVRTISFIDNDDDDEVGEGKGEEREKDDTTLPTTATAYHHHKYRPKRRIFLSDTVGFIRRLPTQLIKAFKSTLEEVKEASLLLHVIDTSQPPHIRDQQRQVVYKILDDLGAYQPVLEVWNKLDAINGLGLGGHVPSTTNTTSSEVLFYDEDCLAKMMMGADGGNGGGVFVSDSNEEGSITWKRNVERVGVSVKQGWGLGYLLKRLEKKCFLERKGELRK